MSESIIVALIGAGGTILAAVLGVLSYRWTAKETELTVEDGKVTYRTSEGLPTGKAETDKTEEVRKVQNGSSD